MDEFKVYSLGFMFSHNMNYVLLRLKKKPAWQDGLLNGIGGLVEPGESSLQAMRREFHEETGLMTDLTEWTCFHTEDFGEAAVHFYYGSMNLKHIAATQIYNDGTGEINVLVPVATFLLGVAPRAIPNLAYLIPMALCTRAETPRGFPRRILPDGDFKIE